jgi:Family of unknown function (DUF5675)
MPNTAERLRNRIMQASRREFGFALAGVSFARATRAEAIKAQLLVVRRSGWQNQCVNCIPGKIYGVPLMVALDTAPMRLGEFTALADTVELSYEDNALGRSSIPVGAYTAKVRTDATKKWMWSSGTLGKGSVLLNRAWRVELDDVPGGRTEIQFHHGKDASWSKGCIILGVNAPEVCQDSCVFSDSSQDAVTRVREYIEAATHSSGPTGSVIRVQIV